MSIGETPDTFDAMGQDWQIDFANHLDQQRERARKLLTTKQDEIQALEQKLSEQLTKIQGQLLHYETDLVDQTARHSVEAQATTELQYELDKREAELSALAAQVLQQQTTSSAQQQVLADQHQQMLDTFSKQLAKLQEEQKRLAEVEARIAAEESRLTAESAHHATHQAEVQRDLQAHQKSLQAQEEEIRHSRESLAAKHDELLKRQADLEAEQDRLHHQRREVARALRAQKQAFLKEREAYDAQAQAVQQSDTAALSRQLSDLTERLLDAQSQIGQLSTQLEHCQSLLAQRDQEHLRLKEELASLTAQIAQSKAANEALQIELAAAKATAESVRAEAVAGSKLDSDAKANIELALADSSKQTAAQALEIVRLTDEIEALQTKRRQQASMAAEQAVEWDRERKELQAQLESLRHSHDQALSAATQASSEPAAPSAAQLQEVEDLRRRLELAMQDVRDLRTKNQTLQQQQAQRPEPTPAAPAAAAPNWSKGMDWETQKKLLMAQLEQDAAEETPEQTGDRLKIEEVIRTTDKVIGEKDKLIAERDAEIVELRRLLENQSDNIGQFAVGASAIAGMLDTDELITLERENLKSLQENLRQQLRQAEVDISLERAKVARERLELEARLAQFEEERSQLAAKGPASASNGEKPGKKNAGSKWFNHMGLGGKET